MFLLLTYHNKRKRFLKNITRDHRKDWFPKLFHYNLCKPYDQEQPKGLKFKKAVPPFVILTDLMMQFSMENLKKSLSKSRMIFGCHILINLTNLMRQEIFLEDLKHDKYLCARYGFYIALACLGSSLRVCNGNRKQQIVNGL